MPARRLYIKRDCPHGGIHKHGTKRAYEADSCRCDDCYGFISRQGAEKRRQQAYGRWEAPFVDAAPVRAHLTELKEAGMGKARIAQVSGIPVATIGHILYANKGKASKLVRREIADVLLATPLKLAPQAIDATASRRRLEALCAIGWSASRVAPHLGISGARIWGLMRQQRISRHNADKISAVYDKLWAAPPPARSRFERQSIARTIKHATARGYAPPLAWDEETLPDPNAQPAPTTQTGYERIEIDELAVELMVDGDRRITAQAHSIEKREAIRRLADAGHDDNSIAQKLGMRRDAVCNTRIRWGIPAGANRNQRAA